MGGWLLQVAMLVLCGAVLAASAGAQQTMPAAPASDKTPQELAKSVHNPFEKFITVPFQATTGFDVGPHGNAGENLNIEPVIPFSVSTDWDLMVRPSLSITYQPSPHENFGLGDLQSSFFLTPHNVSEWIWGAGTILQLPTASSGELGTGRWSAGPTAALIYSKGPWFDGMLAYQLMSFAGDRAKGSVNQTYIEPEVSYNFESGWYIDCDPAMTFDWAANAADGWTIPIGIDAGKAFKVGSRAMSIQLGAYDLLRRPDGAPRWIVRLQLTALLPKG